MKAVIMAGGKGTRLRPLTIDTPKPMVPLLNRPCMEYIIELLRKHGITDIAVTLQYLPDKIREYFGDGTGFGVKLHYFEETEPLGTAGSVMNAAEFLDETFIVISGDALTDFDLDRAIAFHRKQRSLATLVLTQVSTPLEYGVVMTDSQGRVTRFLEKPSWGEVFSDTVNTGIYILEPAIFDQYRDYPVYDFSMNLFPSLLQKKARMYGYIAEGYWSDIGNLQQYRQTQFDMLDRKVNVRIKANEVLPGIFMENHIKLPDRVKCIGPAYIGENCTIQSGSVIGEYCVLGSDNQVCEKTVMERTIIWEGNQIGPTCELQDAQLCSRILLGKDAHIHDGVIIGSGCTLGPGVTIKPGVKVWPNKVIHSNSIVHASIIWGEQTMSSLFRGKGVYGTPNIEMTPEFAGKLASAYGSLLTSPATIGICCSTHPFAAMMKIAFAAGIQSAGIHVLDMGTATTAVCRHAVPSLQLDGAVHVRMIESGDHEQLLIDFMDPQGLPLAKSTERKIENAFWQEDFLRSHAEDIGQYRHYAYAENDYLQKLSQVIKRLEQHHLSSCSSLAITVQYDPSDHGHFVEQWMKLLPFKKIVIHDACRPETLDAFAASVLQNKSDLGVRIGRNGHHVAVVCPDGSIMEEDQLMALKVLAVCELKQFMTIGIPVSAPQIIETMVEGSDLSVVRTKENIRSMLEASRHSLFHPLLDDLYATLLIFISMMKHPAGLKTLLKRIPSFHRITHQIPCAWNEKGTIMRQMMTAAANQTTELIDGIKIILEEGSVLILPDQDEPLFRVIVHAKSVQHAEKLIANYKEHFLPKSNTTVRK